MKASYNVSLTASGGSKPYTWSVSSGSLPPGISLTGSTGQITGKATVSGSFPFTVQATDSSTPALSATQSLKINITTQGASSDQYGGDMNHPCPSAATGFFYTYQDTADKHWWFCDPAGNRFFMLAVQVVDEVDATGYSKVLTSKYGDDHYPAYSQLLNRLNAYGFNTVGDDSSWYSLAVQTPAGPGNPVSVPFIWQIRPSDGFKNTQFPFKDVVSLTSDAYTGYRVDSYPDVFDANYASYANSIGPGPSPWGNAQPFPSFSALDASPWLIGIDLDDGDRTWGFKNAHLPGSGVGPHTAWLVAADSPYQVYTGRWKILYSDPVMHIKKEFATWLQQTADSGPGYASIAALNAAWGASYSTFGTSGVAVTGEVVGTGDGTTTTFTHTLTHTVADPFSLAIVAGSSIVSGDCPWFDNIGFELHSDNDCGVGIPAGTGLIGTPTGSPIAGGSVNYKTGALTIQFSTAPASGQPITVNYIYGGWPHALAGGTGLMDEDGTNTWFPSDFHLPDLLLASPPQVDLDLDNFLGHMAHQYFSTLASAVRAKVPHHLVFTQEFLGAYDRPVIFQQAGKYVDAVVVQDVDTPSQLANVYQLANKPIFLDERFISNPDSVFSADPCDSADNPSYTCQPTQLARGQAYATQMNTDLALTGADGYGFIVGWNYWEMTDKTSERQNFGLFSALDNAYDGVEDRTGSQPCSPELTLPGFACGGETANHGDFLSSVTAANNLWFKLF
ncbi:MAG TPA: Ig domain-containing protein [Candidatus Acidoferrales bacterium]|nr:Ig domain-containing protein [Candidatus Acidoferrales bacterium]